MLQVFGSIQWIHMYVDPKCILISWIFWKMYKNEILKFETHLNASRFVVTWQNPADIILIMLTNPCRESRITRIPETLDPRSEGGIFKRQKKPWPILQNAQPEAYKGLGQWWQFSVVNFTAAPYCYPADIVTICFSTWLISPRKNILEASTILRLMLVCLSIVAVQSPRSKPCLARKSSLRASETKWWPCFPKILCRL